MLKKAICKRCWDKHRIGKWSVETHWRKYKKCYCPYNNHTLPIIKAAPPDNCVYLLEQTTNTQYGKGKIMLNKKLCMKCVTEHQMNGKWWEEDEYNWKYYYIVDCPVPTTDIFEDSQEQHSINGQPPDFCPYLLEHIINAC
jgi:hypothetical protein